MILASASYPITAHTRFEKWQAHMERWVIDAKKQNAGLLLFPEYGAMELVSIFSEEIRNDIRLQVVELDSLKNEFCAVFSDLAKKYDVIIVAPSLPVIEENSHVNRVYVFSPKGLAGYQDKFFMTRFENEQWGIQSGKKNLTLFEASWGTFGVQICYDVEFALGSHLLASHGASLILAPSCTETIRGATRVHIGARARAMENQVYTVVSQTVGNALWSPAVDVNYGFAAYYATPDKDMPEEGIIATLPPQKEGWLVQELDFSKIKTVRDSGQVFNFQDHQHLNICFKNEAINIIRQSV
jgi:predicted amidohydrolase